MPEAAEREAPRLKIGRLFSPRGVTGRLSAGFIPAAAVLLMALVWSWEASSAGEAGRITASAARFEAQAAAFTLETMLAGSRDDILALAREVPDKDGLQRFLAAHGPQYREAMLISRNPADSAVLIRTGHGTVEPGMASPAMLQDLIPHAGGQARKDRAFLSSIAGTTYAVGSGPSVTVATYRLTAPMPDTDSTPRGYVTLGVDAGWLRAALGRMDEAQDPSGSASSAQQELFLFDKQGWMLLQAPPRESVDAPDDRGLRSLTTAGARAGYAGDLGKPGLPEAFRPASEHGAYWRMVDDIKNGKPGMMGLDSHRQAASLANGQSVVGYAPVMFRPAPGAEPEIVCGVAVVMPGPAGSGTAWLLVLQAFAVLLVLTGLAIAMGKAIATPLGSLTTALAAFRRSGTMEEIALPSTGREIEALAEEIRRLAASPPPRQEADRSAAEPGPLAAPAEPSPARPTPMETHDASAPDDIEEPAAQAEPQPSAPRPARQEQSPSEQFQIPEVLGTSPVMDSLRSQIGKAAAANADVLIIGEPGTGKELTAEVIHKHSDRADGQFISINCGALDENLLLDALLGHVKGAFPEAKTDRKGAFHAANRGTLLLDEIAQASPKVQQVLLKTLTTRRITPLGAKEQVEIDVRLIVASNVDLAVPLREGTFREDLYRKLRVMTLRTPPLRDHPDDIPLLAAFFLDQAARLMKKDVAGISPDAMDRLVQHGWPGNVRELKDCVTRAVAMAVGEMVQYDDLRIEEGRFEQKEAPGALTLDAGATEIAHAALSPRQRKAMPFLLQHGSITRLEYQQIVGAGLPLRTAQYDLHDMVKRGFLQKTGKGPATRYVLTN